MQEKSINFDEGMKKVNLLFVFIVLALTMQAQVTITSSSMPARGDTFRYSAAQSTGINLRLTEKGSNQNWDFSNLTPQSQDIYEYLNANKTLYAFYFFNQIGQKTADSFGAGPLKFKNIYQFYSKNSSVFKAEGIGYTYSGIPLAANYTDEDEIYQFPLNYGDSDVSTFRFLFTIPGNLFSMVQQGTRTNIVDGWGSITTPYKTYASVIRVKSIVDEIDTVSSQFGKFPYPRKTVSYKYLATSEKIPVLEIIGNETGGNFTALQIRYRDQYRGSANPKPQIKFIIDKTSGIAGKDTFRVTDVTVPPATTRTWAVTATGGSVSFVKGTNAGSNPAYFVCNTPGTYTLKLTATNFQGTGDTTSVNLITVGANAVKTATKPMLIFPNPAKNQVQLNISENGKIDFFNINGKLIFSSTYAPGKIVYFPTNISAGIYTLLLQTKSGVYSAAVTVNP